MNMAHEPRQRAREDALRGTIWILLLFFTAVSCILADLAAQVLAK